MSLNLHATVRQAINTVNKDITALYIASTGYNPNTAGRQVPLYGAGVSVKVQSQPPSGKDLKHMEFLNLQGTTRTIYIYSDPHAIARVSVKGGDLLQFRGFAGGPVEQWLVAAVAERWDVGQNGLITFSGVGALTALNSLLSVTAVNSGVLNVGDVIEDSLGSIPDNCQIQPGGTGTGGIGTYNMSRQATITETADTIVVIDTKGKAGWSKVYCVLQTDRPVQPS